MTGKETAKAHSTVSISRTFNHPIEKIFRCWTDAEQLKTWWKPGGFKMVNAYMEPRAGGEYTFELLTPDGQLIMQYGRFHEVVSPTKLVFTNKCEARDGCEQETLVTVELAKQGASTELSVRQELIPNQACRDQAEQAWLGVLHELAQELAKPS